MKKIILKTQRPWNWKVFLVLIGLIIPAAFAILPFSLHLLNAYNETGTSTPGWGIIVVNALINGLLIVGLGGIGLLIANRIGLGMPFVESRVKHEPIPNRFSSAVAVGWIAAVGFALSILILQNWVFGPPMQTLFEEIGYTVPEEAVTPPLYGFLAAISAGITEETILRPKLAVLWTANIIFALSFGAAHLPTAATLGWPINTLIVTRTLVLNGIGGLILGWLFWTFGLETAMLAHFITDVILYTLLPIIALQKGDTARYIAVAGVIGIVLLALVWAWRVLVTEKSRQSEPIVNG